MQKLIQKHQWVGIDHGAIRGQRNRILTGYVGLITKYSFDNRKQKDYVWPLLFDSRGKYFRMDLIRRAYVYAIEQPKWAEHIRIAELPLIDTKICFIDVKQKSFRCDTTFQQQGKLSMVKKSIDQASKAYSNLITSIHKL